MRGKVRQTCKSISWDGGNQKMSLKNRRKCTKQTAKIPCLTNITDRLANDMETILYGPWNWTCSQKTERRLLQKANETTKEHLQYFIVSARYTRETHALSLSFLSCSLTLSLSCSHALSLSHSPSFSLILSVISIQFFSLSIPVVYSYITRFLINSVEFFLIICCLLSTNSPILNSLNLA